jgi:hypothetical protein
MDQCQDPRHDGISGKRAHEVGFVDGNILSPTIVFPNSISGCDLPGGKDGGEKKPLNLAVSIIDPLFVRDDYLSLSFQFWRRFSSARIVLIIPGSRQETYPPPQIIAGSPSCVTMDQGSRSPTPVATDDGVCRSPNADGPAGQPGLPGCLRCPCDADLGDDDRILPT